MTGIEEPVQAQLCERQRDGMWRNQTLDIKSVKEDKGDILRYLYSCKGMRVLSLTGPFSVDTRSKASSSPGRLHRRRSNLCKIPSGLLV